jgi:hypothetical protein
MIEAENQPTRSYVINDEIVQRAGGHRDAGAHTAQLAGAANYGTYLADT